MNLNELVSNGGIVSMDSDVVLWEEPECFTYPCNMPDFRSNRVFVNVKHECVICPIMDHMVPFHISTIKNSSISMSGKCTYLRINFICPSTKIRNGSNQNEVLSLFAFLFCF